MKVRNILLLLLVVMLIGVNLAMSPNPAQRNVEFLPDMAHSPAYGSYSEDPNFADGKTERPLVAGTIVRGEMPLHFTAAPADALRAGNELTNPLKATDTKALQRGQAVFETFCLPCHGPAGKGDGVVAQRGFPMPPALDGPNAVKMRDGQIFHVMTYGQKNMPSYASQVERDDRWKVVLFVRDLQRKSLAAAKTQPSVVAATPAQPAPAGAGLVPAAAQPGATR